MEAFQSLGTNRISRNDFSANEFAAITEPFRHELQVHCYRMLGSLQDAEDLVQETLLRAWNRRDSLRDQTALRAWLYKIATNICLDALAHRPKRMLPNQYARPAASRNAPLSPVLEPIWLEPLPDALIADTLIGPEAHYSRQEGISLAFLAALQTLPARQRAVLILRDVLEWSAEETAKLLDLTVPSVNSALHRARTTIAKHYHHRDPDQLTIHAENPQTRQLLNRYVHAWEAADVEELLGLLREDVTCLMPPNSAWFEGKRGVGQYIAEVILGDESRGRFKLMETHANGAPAFAWYRREDSTEVYHAFGIQIVQVNKGLVENMTIFMNPELFRFFALPEKIKGTAA